MPPTGVATVPSSETIGCGLVSRCTVAWRETSMRGTGAIAEASAFTATQTTVPAGKSELASTGYESGFGSCKLAAVA